MFKNKKGFTGLEIMAIVAIIGALVAWQGPNLVKSVGTVFNGGDKNQSKIVHKVDRTRMLYQVDPKNSDKLIPVKETYSEYSNEAEAQQPPETLWQKFLHLGIMIIPIIAIISYLGAWPLVQRWVNKFKEKIAEVNEQKETLKGDAKLIVISVDEGLAAMNATIASADTAYDIASKTLANAGLITDPAQRTAAISNAQTALNIADATLTVATNMKRDFLAAMSRKQDTTTKLLVAELKND